MRLAVLFWLVLLCVPLAVRAATPAPDDFASGLDLPGAVDGAAYSLRLPLAVYEQLTREDLGDLRVFNGNNEPVPHALRRADTSQDRKEVRQDLPLFLLAASRQPDQDDLSLRVRRDAGGTVLTVDAGRGTTATATQPTTWLVDASRLATTPDSLELHWDGGRDALCAVALSHSGDLTRWSPLVTRTVLADLSYHGQAISVRRILLPGRPLAYLRLDRLDCAGGLQLRRVTAVTGTPVLPEQWRTLDPEATSADATERLFRYTLPARVTVRGLRVQLPATNTLVRAVIEARPTADSPWRTVHTGLFYDLNLQGHRLMSEPVACAPTTDQDWRLRITGDDAGPDHTSRRPRLDLGWQADTLVFVGRGPGPYTLAFGSRRLDEAAARDLGLILGAMRESGAEGLLQPIEPGPVRVLGGAAALRPRIITSWTTILLWTVLVAGVGLLALMARSLWRDLHRRPPAQ